MCSVTSLSSKSLRLGLGSFGPRPSPAPSVWNIRWGRLQKKDWSTKGFKCNSRIPAEKEQHVCFCRERDISLCLCPADSTDRGNDPNLIQQPTEKERRGGRSLLTPRSRQLWPPANCLTTFLSHPNSPTSGHGPKQPLLGPLTEGLKEERASLWADWSHCSRGFWQTQRAYSFPIEKFYFRGEADPVREGGWRLASSRMGGKQDTAALSSPGAVTTPWTAFRCHFLISKVLDLGFYGFLAISR